MSANSSCSLYDRRRRRLEEIENIRRFIAWVKERQFLDAKLAKQKAEEERVSTLYYKYLCNQQLIEGGRWHEKRKLREEEINTNATGLVLAEEEWMRIIDGRLEENGIFAGSKTKLYLVDPKLGIIPQLPPEP